MFGKKYYEILICQTKTRACDLCSMKEDCPPESSCNLVFGCYFKECKTPNV